MISINDRFEINVKNHIAYVSITRPQKMNAIDRKTFEAIPQVDAALRADKSIRCVILSGQGGNFCAGLDKSNFESLFASQQNSEKSVVTGLEARTNGIANAPQYAAWMWRELPMPVISAIEGVALGGGLQIALGADFRIASHESKFSILELKWGIIPDMSSTQIMRHMIRDDIIRELTYTARTFSAEEAKEWGFITHISEDPMAHAKSLAQQIVEKNPHAVRAAKRVIDQSYYQTAQEGLLTESREQDKVMGKSNQIEAVMAVFQKRKANFAD
ncbi:MAG: crotonase/enoyl-CoA hydratase family protein [Gammaproteobacteria bacterium]|nr:crotonase/enoyl-CoA hydratase family protein [Gammaproteobacteria bacterium]